MTVTATSLLAWSFLHGIRCRLFSQDLHPGHFIQRHDVAFWIVWCYSVKQGTICSRELQIRIHICWLVTMKCWRWGHKHSMVVWGPLLFDGWQRGDNNMAGGEMNSDRSQMLWVISILSLAAVVRILRIHVTLTAHGCFLVSWFAFLGSILRNSWSWWNMRLPFSGLDEDAPRLGVSTLCMVAHWDMAKRKG